MTCISYDDVFANDIRRNFTHSGTRRQRGLENHIANDSSDDEGDSSDGMYVPE